MIQRIERARRPLQSRVLAIHTLCAIGLAHAGCAADVKTPENADSGEGPGEDSGAPTAEDSGAPARHDADVNPGFDAGNLEEDAEVDATSVGASCEDDAATCLEPSFCPPRGHNFDDLLMPGGESVGVTLKFVEGSHVRLRSGAFTINEEALLDEEPGLLCCAGLSLCQAQAGVRSLNNELSGLGSSFVRLFTRDEATLDMERAQLRNDSGEYLNDLNLYFQLSVRVEDVESVLALLRANRVIDHANLEPNSVPADALP